MPRLPKGLTRFPQNVNLQVMSVIRTPEGGEIPTDFLDVERQEFINAYIKLGFHRILKLGEKEYAGSFPKFSPQPETYKGRFDTPILVETRISPFAQAKSIGLGYPLAIRGVDWEADPKGYRTPKEPYTAWIQDGTKYLGVPVAEVRKNLADDERGATEFDSIPLYIKKGLPLLVHHSVDLPGTDFPPDFAAYLSLDCGTPGICLSSLARPNANWGSATCGRQDSIPLQIKL